MRTVRFVVSLLMGLALLMGMVSVASASAATERALPRCQKFTTFVRDYQETKIQFTMPTTGYMNENTECKLQYGDEYDGVYVLQGAISTCFTDIADDGLYYGVTESVVRLIQGQNGIATDGKYGPDTRDVMRWPWYTMDNKLIGCV
jgi:peptidoglycan hydrolase-like protein with peptidoglycan-binding domain